MFNRKKLNKKKIISISVEAYNMGIEDALEVLELQMWEHGNLVDIRHMIEKIETIRDETVGEVMLHWSI
jgi:hypothetical protein